MKLLLVFIGASFLVQITLCFKAKQTLAKLIPIFISFSCLVYSCLRFVGIIKFENDSSGIFEGGLASGILNGITALAIAGGSLLAWAIYSVYKLNRRHE